ncbi:uncharacterized protein [Coffea arabica]|uniref:Uncharacterized protein n=1 Tax=Coffea arabica TaxID=13443 RepID=A0ABM4V2T5_COFAR
MLSSSMSSACDRMLANWALLCIYEVARLIKDLVNRAFEEALKDAQLIENIAQKSQEQSCQRHGRYLAMDGLNLERKRKKKRMQRLTVKHWGYVSHWCILLGNRDALLILSHSHLLLGVGKQRRVLKVVRLPMLQRNQPLAKKSNPPRLLVPIFSRMEQTRRSCQTRSIVNGCHTCLINARH